MSSFNRTLSFSNQTNSSSPDSWKNIIIYVIYFLEGSTMFLGNISVCTAIWWHRALRTNKGYFVFAFMFFCDAMNGLAQVFAAVYRSFLLLIGTHDVLITQWECMIKLHTFVWAFSEPCAALMLAAIGFDRVLLVSDPGHYINSNSLTYISIAIPFIWSGAGVAVAFFLAYNSPRRPTVAQYCLLSFGLGKQYWVYHGFLSVLGSGLSIALYVTAISINRRRTSNQTNRAILEGQRKLTKTFGISCMVTLFVFLIPRLVGTALDYASSVDRALVSFLMMIFYWILGNFNAVINLFIFIRIDVIRKGVKALWRCRRMPADLRQWSAGHHNTPAVPCEATIMEPKSHVEHTPKKVQRKVPQNSVTPYTVPRNSAQTAWAEPI